LGTKITVIRTTNAAENLYWSGSHPLVYSTSGIRQGSMHQIIKYGRNPRIIIELK